VIFLYNIVLLLASVPAAIILFIANRKRLRKESLYKWHERLGIWDLSPLKRDGRKLIWFHCASLGEVRAIESLLKRLPDCNFIITTMTQTAHKYAEQQRLAQAVYYLPADFTFLIGAVISKVKADMLVLVETELWPGLITEAKKHGMKVVSINGRLSVYSYPYYKLLKPLWEKVMPKIDCASVRSAEDADRFIALGCPAENIRVTGNIKYDALFHMHAVDRQSLGFAQKDLILTAGSTRKGEEEILLDEWIKLRRRHHGLKLIITPRHLTRVSDVEALCASRGVEYRLRSKGGNPGADCVIVDTFGELLKFYAICDVAFIGGSLINSGGQNPIEPAALAKPVVFGIYMQNFLEEARALENSGGAIRVKNREELHAALEKLLSGKKAREEYGAGALKAVENQKGAVERTLKILKAVFSGARY
jgi:3-deoxy-D-manno-octulosonic-acid transferase